MFSITDYGFPIHNYEFQAHNLPSHKWVFDFLVRLLDVRADSLF